MSYSPCPLDMAAAKVENATGAANFYVVKNIAAAVAKEFPDVKIMALAYNGTCTFLRQCRFFPIYVQCTYRCMRIDE